MQSSQLGRPTAFTVPSSDWNSTEVSLSLSPPCHIESLYSSMLDTHVLIMICLEVRSEVLREKLRYLQPYMIGGQADMWTSFAPFSKLNSLPHLSSSDDTVVNEQKLFALDKFVNRYKLHLRNSVSHRLACWHKASRYHVGVYLMNGLAKGMPLLFAYPIA